MKKQKEELRTLRLSHSQLGVYQECRKRYYHEYLKKMEARKAYAPFVFGNAMHRALEEFYLSKGKNCAALMKGAVLEEFDKVEKGPLTPEEINNLEVDKYKVLGICEVYPKIYKGDFMEFNDFLIEEHFELDFGVHAGYKLKYQGFLDGLFQDAAGDWWVFETKTKKYNKPGSNEGANYVKKVHIDNQVLGYIHGGAQVLTYRLGTPTIPKGVIYNVIQKPSISRKKTESLQDFRKRVREEYTRYAEEKEYFARYPLQLKQSLIDNWLPEMKMWLMEIAHKKGTKSKRMFPMNSGACTSKFGTCKWMGSCTSGKYQKLLFKKKDPNFVLPRLQKHLDKKKKEKR